MSRHRTATAVVGDWNLPLEEIEAIAYAVGGQLVRGRGVDHAIVAGVDLVAVHRLGRHGSDHHAIVVDLDVHRHRQTQRVRVLYWNVYVGQHPAHVLREVLDLVNRWQPHLVALSEVYRCRRVLGRVRGYRRVQGRNVGERAEIAVLVRRRGLKLVGHSHLRMRRSWRGPVHGLRHRPRRYVRVRVRFDAGIDFRLVAVHLPTGGPDHPVNGPAVRESARRIIKWARPA